MFSNPLNYFTGFLLTQCKYILKIAKLYLRFNFKVHKKNIKEFVKLNIAIGDEYTLIL